MNLTYIIAALAAALYYFFNKSQGLSGLMANFKTDQQEATKDEQIAKNDGLLFAEADKRKEIEDEKPDNGDNLSDFFNGK